MGTNGDVPEETAYDMASMPIENTWWEVKQSLLRTGASKDLFESYLREWLWRQRHGDDPFGNIKHIADFMKYTEMRKLFLVPLYALFVI